jgi:organic radical activating enzyme
MNSNWPEHWRKRLKTANSRTDISEVFASIQGEGLFIGTMQLFIRMGNVEAECQSIKQSSDQSAENSFWLRTLPGTRNVMGKSPITASKLFADLKKHYPLQQFFCIAMIGSEPLQQMDFISEFLPMLRRENLKIFAQTSAPSVKNFATLVQLVDLLCLDLEVPRKEIASNRKCKRLTDVLELTRPSTTYLRLTVDAHESPHVLLSQLKQLPVSKHTLVLQPRMEGLSHISDWDTGTILEWINLFAPLFAQIRWIPQVHKLLRIP